MQEIVRNLPDIDWITGILFFSLILLVISKRLFYSRFLNFIILPINNKYIFMYNKKLKLSHAFHVLLSTFQLLQFSLFLFLCSAHIPHSLYAGSPFLFVIIVFVLLVFTLIKTGILLGNGVLFDSTNFMSEWVFKKNSYLNFSGLVVFASNIILTYNILPSKPIIYTTITLICIINAVGWVTMIRNHQNFITTHFVYFILYLCALEIAPFFILGSYLNY